MQTTSQHAELFHRDFAAVVANIEQAVLGKRDCVRLALACLFTGGHLLLEDKPGTGKTMLAKALARSVQGDHKRIQFTPDLLPGDITGGKVYDLDTRTQTLSRGPIFTNILLADEINRASPKTQSALLQAMEEGHVTLDGQDLPLDATFMVIATQNPIEQAGTYPLPEAQLDRFLVRTELGYPDTESTLRLLAESSIRDRSLAVVPQITPAGVVDRQHIAAGVHVDETVLRYVNDIATATRHDAQVQVGVSVRGALSLVRLAKTWAASQGRHYVLPDDIKDLAVETLAHRLVLTVEAEFRDVRAAAVIRRIMERIDTPTGVGSR